MSGFQSPNDQKPRTYNINLKIYSALPAFRPFATWCGVQFNGDYSGIKDGSIEVNGQQMERLTLNQADNLAFQLKQKIARSAVIQILTIKHIRQ